MSDAKTELLARIAWLYYVNKKTQEEIGNLFGLSRPSVQRHLNQALDSRIVVTRIDHQQISQCMELSERICERFELRQCDIAPSNPQTNLTEIRCNIEETGAQVMERFIRKPEPITFALGSGTTLRNCIDRIDCFNRPEHNVASLAGLTTPDGTPSEFDLVTPFANKTGARRYYFPFPLVLPSPEERLALEGLTIYSVVEALASKADISFVSISPLLIDSPFLREGFMEKAELEKLIKTGACGEILGQVFDEHGAIINSTFNERLAGVRIEPPTSRLIIGISGGSSKHRPILAALRGQWINGLVTDEITARYLLEH